MQLKCTLTNGTLYTRLARGGVATVRVRGWESNQWDAWRLSLDCFDAARAALSQDGTAKEDPIGDVKWVDMLACEGKGIPSAQTRSCIC